MCSSMSRCGWCRAVLGRNEAGRVRYGRWKGALRSVGRSFGHRSWSSVAPVVIWRGSGWSHDLPNAQTWQKSSSTTESSRDYQWNDIAALNYVAAVNASSTAKAPGTRPKGRAGKWHLAGCRIDQHGIGFLTANSGTEWFGIPTRRSYRDDSGFAVGLVTTCRSVEAGGGPRTVCISTVHGLKK